MARERRMERQDVIRNMVEISVSQSGSYDSYWSLKYVILEHGASVGVSILVVTSGRLELVVSQQLADFKELTSISYKLYN